VRRKLTPTSESTKTVKAKKAYQTPRVQDLGDAIQHTNGAVGNIADGAAGALQTRGHGW